MIGRINDLEHFESNVLSCNVLLLSVISVMIDGLLCLLCGCGSGFGERERVVVVGL